MRVITVNLNGIRSAGRKGFFQWLSRQGADFVCLQELKAQEDQLEEALYWPKAFHCYYHQAEKKGYSGVGLYCRTEPDEVIKGIGWEDLDCEGRWIEARYGSLSIVSLYLPSGSSKEERQAFKMNLLERLLPYLLEQKAKGRDFILCGDWNIAHTNLDIKNWRGNKKNSGFLPEERAWLDQLFGEVGFVDAFRCINQQDEQYTWWSNRGSAWDNNVGWRIDYQVVTPRIASKVSKVRIYKDKRFSDHAPLIMDYDID